MNSSTNLVSGHIPTKHDLLDLDKVQSFADFIDEDLEKLESRFNQFIPQSSLKRELKRNR